MLLGFISDLHATIDPVRRSVERLRDIGVKQIYCIGDICGYGHQLNQVIDYLRDNKIKSICGNHDRWIIKQAGNTWDSNPVKVWDYSKGSFDLIEISDANKHYISGLPASIRFSVDNSEILLVHAEPPDVDDSEGIQLLDYNTGNINEFVKDWWEGELIRYDFDVLVVGHTHQSFAHRFGDKLVINPGSTLFNGTYCYLDTKKLIVKHEYIYDSNQELVNMWTSNGIDKRWMKEL